MRKLLFVLALFSTPAYAGVEDISFIKKFFIFVENG